MQQCPTEGESVGHFQAAVALGGKLPEISIPNGTGRKQSKFVEYQESFPGWKDL